MPYFKPVNPEEPIVEKLFYYKGTTFKFFNQSQDEDGDPYDFTGHSIRMLIKNNKGDADGDAVVTIANSEITLSASTEGTTAGVQDQYLFTYDPSNFATLTEEPFRYFYVIEVTDGAGEIFNHYKGEFIVKSD